LGRSAKKMKPVLILTFVLFTCLVGTAEPVELRKRTLPTLSITSAIEKAEKYISENGIDISNKFLSAAKYHETGPWTEGNPNLKTSGPYWQITYEMETFVLGGQCFILVYMDGKIVHVGGR